MATRGSDSGARVTAMVLQKVPTPGRLNAYVQSNDDFVSGYVLSAADTVGAGTPDTIVHAHGLGFPGSPYRPGMELLYVLRFALTESMQLLPADGGNTPADAAKTGGQFIDHPPFTGTGFTTVASDPVPLWWLDATRLPPGTELWRIHAHTGQVLAALYTDVAHGWQLSEGNSVEQATPTPPSDVAGTFCTWRGERCLADPLPDGQIVIGAFTDIPGAGLTITARGLWTRTVPTEQVSDLHLLRMTCTWHGHPFLILRRWHDGQQLQARLFYLGRNAHTAEALQLIKTDAGCYETTLPMDQLTDIQAVTLSGP